MPTYTPITVNGIAVVTSFLYRRLMTLAVATDTGYHIVDAIAQCEALVILVFAS
jgi:hypothetical protein